MAGSNEVNLNESKVLPPLITFSPSLFFAFLEK